VIPNVLTIAGTDPTSGAGIQADLKTFSALRTYGLTVITALVAQNTQGVRSIHEVPEDFVGAQLDAVFDDVEVHAVKIGMLSRPEVIETVAAGLERHGAERIVVDPVMVAKSGDSLLDEDAIVAVRGRLLPLCAVVTPNRREAEVLAGVPVRTHAEARDAARRLADRGCPAVVIKGGHFEGPRLVNLLFDGHDFTEIESERVDTTSTHGTGCTFAAAIAAHLARGRPLPHAVRAATEYVAGAIAHASPIGRGHGPVDHFWRGLEDE
jgi:hydroxymethylpyrimidine/phosphomethylpyrimidine kinase